MKAPPLGLLAGGIIVLTVALLATIGAPIDRPAPASVATSNPEPATVNANGVTLASTSVELPADDATYPDGPHADLVNANCTACHSASMALAQPALSTDQWKAEVTKMREVYKAPVAEADMPAIVAYLTTLPGQQKPAGGNAQKAPG